MSFSIFIIFAFIILSQVNELSAAMKLVSPSYLHSSKTRKHSSKAQVAVEPRSRNSTIRAISKESALPSNITSWTSLSPATRYDQQGTCSSWDFKPSICYFARDIADGRIVRHSKSSCISEYSYFIRDHSVTVARGCRATFYFNLNGNKVSHRFPILCQSWDYQTKRCLLNRKIYGITLEAKFSNAACIYGSSFRAEEKAIVVSAGCRALFYAYV